MYVCWWHFEFPSIPYASLHAGSKSHAIFMFLSAQMGNPFKYSTQFQFCSMQSFVKCFRWCLPGEYITVILYTGEARAICSWGL